MSENQKDAIVIAEMERLSAGRAKYIDMGFKRGVKSVRDGTVRVCYVPTHQNYADIITKASSETKVSKVYEMSVSLHEEKGTMLSMID